MKSSPIKLKQKLSQEAADAKKERDEKYMREVYGPKKAFNQRERRKKSAAFLKGKDYDHTKNKFVSVKANRGGYGKGTKPKK